MDAKKVVKGIEMVEDGLAEIKAGLLAEIGEAEAPEEAPKKKTGKKSAPVEEETPKKKAGKAKTKAAKEEVEDDEDDEVDYASMKYNDLKKLAVERGMKSPNVSKDEIIAFLKGEPVEDADDEDVEPEDVENETDEEDLTAKVTSMLEDVDTEDIADFLAENGISAKGKRPSLIAKIVTAIEDGDLSLEDLEVEDEDSEPEETEPVKKPKNGKKKSVGAKSKEPEEDDEEEDEDEDEEESENPLGYEYDEDEDVYTNDEEESELLATVSSARMDACVAYMEDVEKSIKKKSAKAKLVKELEEFFGDEFDAEEDDIVASAGIKFLLMTDDEGETHDMEDPYEINEIVCCCGRPLTETDDGYVCDVCESEYDDE